MNKIKINEIMFERLLTVMDFWEDPEEMVIELSDEKGNELVFIDQKICVILNEETYWIELDQLISVQRDQIYAALVEQVSRCVDVIIYETMLELNR